MTAYLPLIALIGVIPPADELVAARHGAGTEKVAMRPVAENQQEPQTAPGPDPAYSNDPAHVILVQPSVPAGHPGGGQVWRMPITGGGYRAMGLRPPHFQPTAQPYSLGIWGILGGRPLLPRYPADHAYHRTHGYDLYKRLDYPWTPPPAWKRRGDPPPRPAATTLYRFLPGETPTPAERPQSGRGTTSGRATTSGRDATSATSPPSTPTPVELPTPPLPGDHLEPQPPEHQPIEAGAF